MQYKLCDDSVIVYEGSGKKLQKLSSGLSMSSIFPTHPIPPIPLTKRNKGTNDVLYCKWYSWMRCIVKHITVNRTIEGTIDSKM